MFMEDMLVRDLQWHSRLYVDGRNVQPPKPLVVYERNPRAQEYGLIHENGADLFFDHVLLENNVSEKLERFENIQLEFH